MADGVDLSKYKVAGTSLSRTSKGVEGITRNSVNPSATASASARRASVTDVDRMSRKSATVMVQPSGDSVPSGPKMLPYGDMKRVGSARTRKSMDSSRGGPPPSLSSGLGTKSSVPLGRESRIREMQRTSAQMAMDRTSMASSASFTSNEDRKADIERISVELKIVESETNAPVTFKFDGSRFQLKETLKLYHGLSYKISLKTSPPMQLEQNVLKIDTYVSSDGKSKTKISDALYLDAVGEGEYVCLWECTIPKSGKGERCTSHMSLELKDFCKVSIQVLAKVYKENDKSGQHGQPLRTIMYTAKRAETQQSYASVVHTQYIEGQVG